MPTSPTAYVTGQTDEHLCSPGQSESLGVRVHRDVVRPFLELQSEAREQGFDLQILSGFRSFDDQLSIWNRKATGQRAVLDSNAVPLDIAQLDPRELAFAILRWSALPGASRHHWGTDLDVYDAAAQPDGYEIELIPEEVNPGGMFGPLHEWLDPRPERCGAGALAPELRSRRGWVHGTTHHRYSARHDPSHRHGARRRGARAPGRDLPTVRDQHQ